MTEPKAEPIGGGIVVYTSEEHRFGTDAFLLTAFSHYKAKDTVVEFGTGCGIIPLLMQKRKPPKRIYALDVQENAVEQLRMGIAASSAANIVPVCADLRELWEGAPLGQTDLVLCNPPYQPPGRGSSRRTIRSGSPDTGCSARRRTSAVRRRGSCRRADGCASAADRNACRTTSARCVTRVSSRSACVSCRKPQRTCRGCSCWRESAVRSPFCRWNRLFSCTRTAS